METPIEIELLLALLLLITAVFSFALEKIRMEITAISLLALIGYFAGIGVFLIL